MEDDFHRLKEIFVRVNNRNFLKDKFKDATHESLFVFVIRKNKIKIKYVIMRNTLLMCCI